MSQRPEEAIKDNVELTDLILGKGGRGSVSSKHQIDANPLQPIPDSAAMDDLEGKYDVKADQRVDQFVRLRDAIEERASRKFFEGPVEAEGPVVLRSNDFFK
jgi:hypothetical protein